MHVSYLCISVFELVGGDYQEVADRAMIELVEGAVASRALVPGHAEAVPRAAARPGSPFTAGEESS